jgi:hypothetical protein
MLAMSTARRSFFLFAMVASVLAFAFVAPALAAEGPAAHPDQIVLSGNVNVPRGKEVGEVVVLHGTVQIGGVADGDVVLLDGNIVVQGQVSGSVIAVNGTVSLGPNAQVGGDVIARGAVLVSEGAIVTGSVREHAVFAWRTPISAFGRFASWLAVTVSTLVLGLLLLLIAPRGADAVFGAARTAPWASLGWGVAAFVGLPVLGVAALASLVGLPFGLELLLGLAFLFSVGYAYFAWTLGRLLWRPPRNRAIAFAFGWSIVRAVALAPVVSGITWAVGAAFGLGAMTVATWRARQAGGRHREGRGTQVPAAP